jgi:hypothetical protein
MTRRIYTDAQPKIIRDLVEAGRSGSGCSACLFGISAACREAGLHGCTFGANHDASVENIPRHHVFYNS